MEEGIERKFFYIIEYSEDVGEYVVYSFEYMGGIDWREFWLRVLVRFV